MTNIKYQSLLDTLKSITHPVKGLDILTLGMVEGLILQNGDVTFSLKTEPADIKIMEKIRLECNGKLMSLPHVNRVTSMLTSEKTSHQSHHPVSPQSSAQSIPGVKHVIAIASGKGGVGKSTTAVNLACGLQKQGLKVGIFDMDIYGPSIPMLLGINERPHQSQDKKIIPLSKNGLISMSLGYLIKNHSPIIWRGPMVMNAIKQMIGDTLWDNEGTLDVLVLDLPPGTGDVQLTLVQNIKVDGAIIISTPQDIALIDARKGLDMFRKTQVSVLGIIENMSHFICPSCGEESHIFGHGGARKTAHQLGVDFLGDIPLHISIREAADKGKPLLFQNVHKKHHTPYTMIAQKICSRLM